MKDLGDGALPGVPSQYVAGKARIVFYGMDSNGEKTMWVETLEEHTPGLCLKQYHGLIAQMRSDGAVGETTEVDSTKEIEISKEESSGENMALVGSGAAESNEKVRLLEDKLFKSKQALYAIAAKAESREASDRHPNPSSSSILAPKDQ